MVKPISKKKIDNLEKKLVVGKQDWLKIAKDAFDHYKPFYPSFSDFMNYIKDKHGADFIYVRRKDLTEFYFAQEIVQVFQPPPTQYMLKREKGYYPKLIAFYPFERLYSDTGKIIIYPMTRKEARKKDKTVVAPVVAGVAPVGDIDARIKLYKNKRDVADTAYIEFRDSKGTKFRFEKRLGDDIPKSKQWINDNILQPYLQLTTDNERDEFLKNKKAKK
jgi:hypothetical protein